MTTRDTSYQGAHWYVITLRGDGGGTRSFTYSAYNPADARRHGRDDLAMPGEEVVSVSHAPHCNCKAVRP